MKTRSYVLILVSSNPETCIEHQGKHNFRGKLCGLFSLSDLDCPLF